MRDTRAELLEIMDLAAAWRSGWLAGDADAILSLYSDDPVLMPQDHPAVFGKDAIRSLYEPVLRAYDFQSESKVLEVEADDKWGYFWSAYLLTATPKTGGESLRSAGKSVFIVKRQAGGAWRITRLIDNSDGPPRDGEP